MKELIKNAFKNVYPSEDVKIKIMRKIMRKEKKNYLVLKLSLAVMCLFIISIVIFNIDNIKAEVSNWYIILRTHDIKRLDSLNDTEITLESSGYKKISDTATIAEEQITTTLMEVEEDIEIKLLKFDNATSDIVYYSTKSNKEGTIGEVIVWYPSMTENTSMMIKILNEGADANIIDDFKTFTIFTIKSTNTYKSTNLGIDIISYLTYNENDYNAVFIYDNILYDLNSNNESDLKNIIENLHL